MPDQTSLHPNPEDLRSRFQALEETQRATMNILEDFNEERQNLQQVQKATLNLLEDIHGERNKLGEIQRALINILEDIEVERLKVEQSKVQLEAVNRELEAFTYSVSHDLRAPLRAVSGFAEAVIEDYAPRLDDEGKRYLGLIQDNAHKMGQLIDDLLTFSRLGRQQLAKSSVDMKTLATTVFEELTTQAHDRTIDFTVANVPPALGDSALLRQVLVNLISNAIKFTRTQPRAVIEFGYSSEAEESAYYVKDNGVGFEMQYANKLFGVFQRLHSAADFEGNGVGLALVYRIVTRHGGRVWAHSDPGRETAFYFTLPGGRPV